MQNSCNMLALSERENCRDLSPLLSCWNISNDVSASTIMQAPISQPCSGRSFGMKMYPPLSKLRAWMTYFNGQCSSSVIDFAQETKKHQSRFCLKAADGSNIMQYASLEVQTDCLTLLSVFLSASWVANSSGVVASGPTVAKWCFKMTPGDLSASSEMYSQRVPKAKGVLF